MTPMVNQKTRRRKARAITPAEGETMTAMRLAGHSTSEIGRALGRIPSTVNNWLKARGIFPPSPHEWDFNNREEPTAEELEQMIAEQMKCLPTWWKEPAQDD